MDSGRWHHIAHIYEAVLERTPEERGAFLAEASSGDEELRREVESLLAHDSAPVLIDRPMLWEEHWPDDWSSKGILFERGMDFDSVDLWMLPVDGDRKPYPVLQEPGNQGSARLSPDGRWVAYTHRSERTSRPDVYVHSLSTGVKWRISTGGGTCWQEVIPSASRQTASVFSSG